MFKRLVTMLASAAVLVAPPLIGSACAQRAARSAGHAAISTADLQQAVTAPGRPAAAVQLDEVRRPVEVLHYLGLRRGDHVLDYVAGTGYYSEIMARAVGPQGYVVAWNPPSLVSNERARTTLTELRQRNPNVALVSSPVTALSFPAEAYDFAMLHMVYHDAYWESRQYNWPRIDPNSVTQALYRAMKPGGIVAVVDHVANPGGDTRAVVEQYHRIDPAVIRADFERAGFRFVGESDLLRVPTDPHTVNVFDPSIRGRTDRVVYRFEKPRDARR